MTLFSALAIALMMAAAVAFALQCMFVAASETALATPAVNTTASFGHAHAGAQGHVVIHRHADGTIHQHAIDDDDDALAKHVKRTRLGNGACGLCPSLPEHLTTAAWLIG
jgi:hypothetical protein